MPDTRQRILDTAEICFAQRGYNGTTLEEIARLADTDLDAITYHFHEKSSLFGDVLRRRIEPMNQRRIELMERTSARNEPAHPSLDELLYAYLRPLVEALDSPARGTMIGLLHRVHEGNLDPALYHELFAPIQRRFSVMRKSLPTMSDQEYQGRSRFIIGGLVHLLADRMWSGAELDSDTLTQMVVEWAAATLRAPVLLVERDADPGPR